MVLEPIAKRAGTLKGILSDAGFQELVQLPFLLLVPRFALPRLGEDQVEFIVEVARSQRFPLPLIEPNPTSGGTVDEEPKAVTDTISLHRQSGLGADSDGFRSLFGSALVVVERNLRKTLGML